MAKCDQQIRYAPLQYASTSGAKVEFLRISPLNLEALLIQYKKTGSHGAQRRSVNIALSPIGVKT